MEPRKFLVAGEWRTSSDAFEVKNPFNGDTVALVFKPAEKDLEDAVQAANDAFRTWKKTPLHARRDLLLAVSRGLQSRLDDFARTVALEAGKPIKTARAEVSRSVGIFLDSVAAAGMFGDVVPLDVNPATEGRLGLVRRFPVGPVAAISPFNFPLNLVSHKYAPAVGAGYTCVHKPASATPLSALDLAGVLVDCGLPPGVVNVLPLAGAEAEKLATDKRLKGLTFTGSAEVGWELKRKAFDRKVSLELGGNAAAVVHEDADLDYAAERITLGGYSYAGQSCISAQRILVHENVRKSFLEKLVEKVEALKTGNPLVENIDVGPLITEKDARRVEEWIAEAVEKGSKLLCGGDRKGSIIVPAVLDGMPSEAKICRGEIFGPAVVVEGYSDIGEMLNEVNNSEYGLQAGIFTNDMALVWRFWEEVECGGVVAGDMPTLRADNQPYGGVKKSGFGREGVRYAMEEMTEPRILIVDTARGRGQ